MALYLVVSMEQSLLGQLAFLSRLIEALKKMATSFCLSRPDLLVLAAALAAVLDLVPVLGPFLAPFKI